MTGNKTTKKDQAADSEDSLERKVKKYWTRRRMKESKPLPVSRREKNRNTNSNKED